MFLSLQRPIFSLLRFPSQFWRRFISLCFSTKQSMADQDLDAVDSEEIPHAVVCCICLDLLYKPIVLSCGHVSCFWCVHKSMNGYRESHCPLCRRPYYHFPTICEMFHLLILKIYPEAYKKRENQILEEEKKIGFFSPQFDALACGSQACKEVEYLGDSANSELNVNTSNDSAGGEPNGDSPIVRSFPIEELNSLLDLHGQKTQNHEQVSVADAQCPACIQLLFRPVVLNCGHAFCESCIMNPDNEIFKCQACQFLQPKGFPNVCLELDQFLREQFPEEYSLRRECVERKVANIVKHENPNSCCNEEDNKNIEALPRWGDIASKVHSGVGCDFCGMFPIIGDRYRCKDCSEKIGFDLCSECYNTRSKRPGRFNQQHTPEHKFELIHLSDYAMVSSVRLEVFTGGMLADSSNFFIPDDDDSESLDDIGATAYSYSDARESDEITSDGRSHMTFTNNTRDQDDSQQSQMED